MAATTTMANVQDGDKVWRKHILPMSDADALKRWDVIDVLKLSGVPAKRIVPAKPGVSDEAQALRNQLVADPYNMFLINELSYVYAKEAHLDKCANVLVRGWKRANEIEDKDVRFRFLLKLCDCSFKLGKFHQADAVIRDIEEPENPRDLRAYLIAACKVYANKPTNGDLLMSLKAFQRAIDGADSALAVRILAMTCTDLKKVGGYEAAKAAVEKLSQEPQDASDLQMLESYVQARETKPVKEDRLERNIVVSITVVVVAMVVYFLYVMEKWSLAKLH